MPLLRAVKHAHLPSCALAVVCLLLDLACGNSADGNQRARPDALIVLPGAIEVHDTDENEGTVLYQLKEEYPALPVIQTIKGRLEGTGWRPLENSFLNPGSSTSFVRGWTSHEDRTRGRASQVYQWVGQWEDDSKRIVWYDLTYDAVTTSDGQIQARGPLNVSATLLSAAAVRTLQEAVKNPSVPK